jgi:SH3 domain protein
MGHRIIDFLKSGTAMEIIGTGPDSKWTQVKLTRNRKDKKGWIQSQYLSAKPIAKTLLVEARKKISTIATRNTALTETLNQNRSELDALRLAQNTLNKDNIRLQEELYKIKAVSGNAIKTERLYHNLQKGYEQVKLNVEKLEIENSTLESDNLANGIKWGVIAILLGAILTLIIPRMSARKPKDTW